MLFDVSIDPRLAFGREIVSVSNVFCQRVIRTHDSVSHATEAAHEPHSLSLHVLKTEGASVPADAGDLWLGSKLHRRIRQVSYRDVPQSHIGEPLEDVLAPVPPGEPGDPTRAHIHPSPGHDQILCDLATRLASPHHDDGPVRELIGRAKICGMQLLHRGREL